MSARSLPDRSVAGSSAPASPLPPPQTPGSPTFSQTFSWADGEQVYGDYGWMTSDEAFSGEDDWEPRPYLVETWERTAAEVRWTKPAPMTCYREDDEDCEIDGEVWEWHADDDGGGEWRSACNVHRAAIGDVGTERVSVDESGKN